MAQRQQTSVAKMAEAVAKQQAAAQSQIGGSPPTDSFFATGWTTAAALPMPSVIPGCSSMPEEDLKPLIAASAKTEDLKPELIRSVIRHESDSFPCAVSLKGALGLMQLMPDVAQQFGADPLDPKQNVAAGSKYLKQLLGRYKGDVKLALAAYNAGPQRVDSEQKVPAIPETTAYVDAILKDLKQSSAKFP